MFHEIRKMVKRRFSLPSSEEALNIGGIIIFFLIISISKFKGPNYVIPLFPFFAVLAAKWTPQLYDNLQSKFLKWFSGIQYFVLVAIWAITIYVTALNVKEISIPIIAILLVLFSIFILGIYFLRDKLSKVLVAATATIAAFGMLFNSFIVPLSFSHHSMLQACNIVNAQSDQSTKFIMLDTKAEPDFSDDTFNFYLSPDPIFSNDIGYIKQLSEGWVFADPEDYELLRKNNIEFTEVIKMPHLGNIKPAALNPKTKEKAFRYNYLLKL